MPNPLLLLYPEAKSAVGKSDFPGPLSLLLGILERPSNVWAISPYSNTPPLSLNTAVPPLPIALHCFCSETLPRSSNMRAISLVRALPRIYNAFSVAVFSSLIAIVSPDDTVVPCATTPDRFIGNAQSRFSMTPWMQRGNCIRAVDAVCYKTLLDVLNNLVELRKAEYSGAAGVLALLPTINAILGAPTNEVWTLMTILPFGGALAMALSFGGAIMPVHVEDYEHAMRKGNQTIGTIVSFRQPTSNPDPSIFEQKLDQLDEKVRRRIDRKESISLGHSGQWSLAAGLLGMTLLLIGSQAAMTVVEQGGVIPWWCGSRWWMHLWYFLGKSPRTATLKATA